MKTISRLSPGLCLCMMVLINWGRAAQAQELLPGPDTQLLLHFNSSTTGVAGETPALETGLDYASGKFETGASFSAGDRLSYAADGNITATAGTVETWFKPDWSGNDNQNHVILTWGDAGGIYIAKDSNNYLRLILNRYGAGGQSEQGASFAINSWAAGQWHHLAFTWDAGAIKIYVDGSVRGQSTPTITLPEISAPSFEIGGEYGGTSLGGTLDELRISNSAHPLADVLVAYNSGGYSAAELPSDINTQLLLHFNGHTTGMAGETPSQSSGVSYATGRFNLGASLSTSDRLSYAAANNITATSGTVEGWFQPEWNGNDAQNHLFLTWGGSGGLLLGKDAADNLRLMLNRYSAGGLPEVGTALNIGDWLANEWHHVAFTWDAAFMRIYVDGNLAAETPVTITLPTISATTFQIGGEGTSSSLRAVVDEFRISNIARTAEEIAQTFIRGLQVISLSATPDELLLHPTWFATLALTAQTDLGPFEIPALAASWSSSAPGIASVTPTGLVTGMAVGSATVSATYQSVVAEVPVSVTSLGPPPLVEELDPFLTTPAEGYIYDIPVVIISYLPTQDGESMDAEVAGWEGSLDEMRQQIATNDIRVKFSLEEGSRFRGFDNPDAPPSLGYRVVEKITVFEPLPPGPGGPDTFQPDYAQILTRFNAEHWVNDLGVKEIWIWGYHFGNIYPVESNMSSPTTGDISNSYRLDDLPIYDHTYVLYNYNFTRSQAEAVHNHGHQLEAILSHVNWLQDGNTDLFWHQFSGQDEEGNAIWGRCGNTHMPPNTTEHYDYMSENVVESDIRSWEPDGGPTGEVDVWTWADQPYAWPYDDWDFSQREESHWYIFWMQSMPGFLGTVPYQETTMTNWWVFTADWDAAINAGMGLYGTPTPEAPQVSATILDGEMHLTWPAVEATGGVTYLVYRAEGLDSPYSVVGSTTGNSWTDSGVATGDSLCRYQVRASVPAIPAQP